MKRMIVAALAVAAVLQGGILVYRLRAAANPAPAAQAWTPGDTLPALSGRNGDGNPVRREFARADGRWTVILAFSSTCAFCDEVAPEWKTWLEQPRIADVIALTRDEPAEAERYRQEHGWDVPVLALPEVRTGSGEHQLVARTPWFFLVDPSGVLRHHAHGSYLAQADSVISAAPAGPVSLR